MVADGLVWDGLTRTTCDWPRQDYCWRGWYVVGNGVGVDA